MTRVLLCIALLASSGCGVYHAIFWRELLKRDELCTRYEELRAQEESCGIDTRTVRDAQCNATDCWGELKKNGCDTAFAEYADCLFTVDASACPEAGEARLCEQQELILEGCRGPGATTSCSNGGCPPPDGLCSFGEQGCSDCDGANPGEFCVADVDCEDTGQVCSRVCTDDPGVCDNRVTEPTCRSACDNQGDCNGDICIAFGDRRTCEQRACDASPDCSGPARCVSPGNNLVDAGGMCLIQCDPLSCPAPGDGSCAGCSFDGHSLAGCIQTIDIGGNIADFVCAPVFASAVGDGCTHGDDCLPGAICHQGICRELCSVADAICDNGGTCSSLSGEVGVCL